MKGISAYPASRTRTSPYMICTGHFVHLTCTYICANLINNMIDLMRYEAITRTSDSALSSFYPPQLSVRMHDDH